MEAINGSSGERFLKEDQLTIVVQEVNTD